MKIPYQKSALEVAIENLNKKDSLFKSAINIQIAHGLESIVAKHSLVETVYSQAAVLSKIGMPPKSTINFFNEAAVNKLFSANTQLTTALSFFQTVDKFTWLQEASIYKNLGLLSLKTNNEFKSILDCVNGKSFLHVNNQIELLTIKSLGSLNYNNICSRLGPVSAQKDLIIANLVNLSTAYSGISTQVLTSNLGKKLYNATSKDYFINAQLAEIFSVPNSITDDEAIIVQEINEEHNNDFELMLSKLNPHFFRKWKGAVQVLESNFEDRIAQFATSVREILGHTLRTIAPEDEVLKWLNNREDKSMYDNNNKPTRAAKIEFICRNCDNKNIIDYMKKKRTAIISIFDILNSGTHKIEPAFSQLEANFLKIGMESDLNYLLQIHFQFNY